MSEQWPTPAEQPPTPGGELPAPGEQQPTPGIRAADRDREATLEVLALAVSDGQLTLEEYSERVDAVLRARLLGDLERVTNDLQQAQQAPAGAGIPAPPPEPQRLTAILSSDGRRGRWRVPPRLEVRSVLGECTLELQSATLTSHHTVIEARTLLGSVSIYVPEGVDVHLTGSAILGSKYSDLRGTPAPGAPVIQIRAHAVLGEISVKHPKLTHGLRDAAREALGRGDTG